MKNFQTGKQTIIPYHNKALKKGLEQAILKQAGLEIVHFKCSERSVFHEKIILSGNFS